MNIESTANKLYEAFNNDSLSDNQKEKFYSTCKKAIIENPELDFSGWKTAAKIYLNFIVDFPDLGLGEIKIPR